MPKKEKKSPKSMKHAIHAKKLNINENKNKQLWETLSWLHGDSLQAWKATQSPKHKQEKIKIKILV